MPRLRPLPCALAALLAHAAAQADDFVLQRVLVEGARTSQLGIVDSASAGSVSQKDLLLQPVSRPGELLEAAPGVIVSQHSGEGKANQFYLRGFNLDHGTDLATFVDGMPVNQRSHAHGQGWTDLNFLIPELTARLDYKKGPYSAREGDFASAGSASLTYANRLVQDVASATVGQDGFARTLLAASPALAGGSLLYALEVLHNDGPFTHPDDYRKINGVLRYSRGYANNGWSVTAMAYHGRWNSTDQIPQRAVDSGALGRYDALDPSDGGRARRASLSGMWRRTAADSASKVSAYLIRNQLDLYSNFTYFDSDPVGGDQFSQPDRRVTSGADATHTWHMHRGDLATDLTVGAQAQNDNVFNGLYATRDRQRLSTTRADHVVESSAALFVESARRWSDVLRSVAGLRADSYRFDVRSDRAQNSGRASARLVSPSLNLAFGPFGLTEFYANIGNGFHSNDARGTVATLDPASGQAIGSAPGLVRSHGMELGVRTEAIPKNQASLSVYRLDFASELTFVGDAGTTEAGPPSRRYGFEFSNYYKPFKWLSIDFDAALAHARARGTPSGAAYLPGAVEGVGQFALTVDRLGPWSGALRLRYFGPRPLVEDNSVRSQPSLTLNGRVGYRIGNGMQVEVEGFNLTNRQDAAVSYFYASRLRSKDVAREDVHFHPIAPRSLRVTLARNW
jgi:hypothetical protein